MRLILTEEMTDKGLKLAVMSQKGAFDGTERGSYASYR